MVYSPKKILLVDDDSNNLSVVSKCFEDRNYDLLYAPDGQAGYEVAVKAQPDLVIMDWAMPMLNGIDATLKLKATDETKDIPVIMATGIMTSPINLQKALNSGATDYVRKPFNDLELCARVNAALMLGESIKKIKNQAEEINSLLIKEKELLKERLDFKERELSILSLSAQDKTKLLMKIQNALKELKKEFNLDSSKTLQSLQKLVKEGMKNKDTDEFLFHFQHVHPDFFRLLKSRSQKLTSNELKLCSYVKLGMRNKEIASITGTSVGTVKSNINRLKKKLALDSKKSLRRFVLEIH